MSWALREGVSLHPLPFGGAFVLDEARLAVRQIGSGLAALLADPAADRHRHADAMSAGVSPALDAEIRLGVQEGWLIHQEETV